MSLEDALQLRSGSTCELCASNEDLAVFAVAPIVEDSEERSAYLCGICRRQITDAGDADVHHWRCLADSMWSPVPAVQVLAWRMLTRLSAEPWCRDLLETLYLEDEILAWAKAQEEESPADGVIEHRDCNGAVLAAGDTVILIKDLNVKGAGFTAKRGTAVRGIALVGDNPRHIEGRVNGQQIVILTEFVKKSA